MFNPLCQPKLECLGSVQKTHARIPGVLSACHSTSTPRNGNHWGAEMQGPRDRARPHRLQAPWVQQQHDAQQCWDHPRGLPGASSVFQALTWQGSSPLLQRVEGAPTTCS